jgi:hypothetical protein
MTKEADGNNPPARQESQDAARRADNARRAYGPRELGALIPALTRPAFRRRSPATAQVLADWPAIVGPRLAQDTLPRRLSGGTLTIACSGPMALELQHLAAALTERINTHLGQRAVERLRFVQEVLPRPAAPPPRLPAVPPPEIPGLPEGPLREALQRLGQAVAARRRDG